MVKKFFFSLLLLCAIDKILIAEQEQQVKTCFLKKEKLWELERLVLGFPDIPLEEQKQKIRQIHTDLKNVNIEHTSLIEKTCLIRAGEFGISIIKPEILEFLVTELGYTTKSALLNILINHNLVSYYLDSPTQMLKNMVILEKYAFLTELERKKIIKFIHHEKQTYCKKLLRFSTKEERDREKIAHETAASKKIDEVEMQLTEAEAILQFARDEEEMDRKREEMHWERCCVSLKALEEIFKNKSML
jgi:hypothetical protein